MLQSASTTEAAEKGNGNSRVRLLSDVTLVSGGLIMPCDGCGRMTPAALLDGKPDNPENPGGSDWNRAECASCYGPGYCRM